MLTVEMLRCKNMTFCFHVSAISRSFIVDVVKKLRDGVFATANIYEG